MTPDDTEYYPLGDTARLYAGWLLAFLLALYAAAGLQWTRSLPFHITILEDWLFSGAIRNVTFFTFLFLLLSTIHRLLSGGIWKGIGLAIVGFALMAAFMAF